MRVESLPCQDSWDCHLNGAQMRDQCIHTCGAGQSTGAALPAAEQLCLDQELASAVVNGGTAVSSRFDFLLGGLAAVSCNDDICRALADDNTGSHRVAAGNARHD